MDDQRNRLDWFKAVILPHESALRGRVARLRGSRGDVDDVVSEVLIRAYSTDRWCDIHHGRAFLFAIARNLMIDEVRREKIVSFDTMADLDLLQHGLDAEAHLCARDELRQIEKVVAAMPPQAAQVFIKRRVEQKTPREIAEEMSLSVSTVEKHLSKAIRLLMRAMAEQEADCVRERQCDSKGRDRAASC